jgi:Uma2 family endonuclease
MQEYIYNGVRLGSLLNPRDQVAEIYRQAQEVEILRSSVRLSGEDVALGFVLELKEIFES